MFLKRRSEIAHIENIKVEKFTENREVELKINYFMREFLETHDIGDASDEYNYVLDSTGHIHSFKINEYKF